MAVDEVSPAPRVRAPGMRVLGGPPGVPSRARDPRGAHARELLALVAGIGQDRATATIEAADGLLELSRSTPDELAGRGLGRGAAGRLAAAFELGRRAAAQAAAPGWRVRAPADVGERLAPALRHLEREELHVLVLNTKNVVLGVDLLYRGNLAGSSVRVGEVFREAVRRCAAAIVVVHNHPSGDPTPSADDIRITGELAEAGRLLDIELLDHVIVAADRWVSLRALGGVG